MEITSEKLKEKISNGDKVIIDFYSDWCGPCKIMKPIFEKVSQEIKENNSEVEMYTMNVENNREFATQIGIRAIPTIKVFSSGNVVDTKMGVLQETQLKELVKNLING